MITKKIVVIDDDRDICLLMDRFLRRNGFDVKTAESGASGLKLIKDFEPHLLLTDFKLGDMNGDQLLKRVKEQMPELPVIVITGYSDIKVAINVMKLGAYDYVTKPLFPDEILITINKALASEQKIVRKEGKTTKAKPLPQPNYQFGNSMASKNLLKQMAQKRAKNLSAN